jgi:hypothetical protein
VRHLPSRLSVWTAAVVASLVLTGAGAGATAFGASPRSAGPVASTPPSLVAARDVASLLPRLHLPAGAVQSARPPPGAGPALVAPSIAPVTSNLASSVTYWSVPGTPAAVIAYITADPPADSRVSLSGTGGQNGVITSTFVGFDFPATKVLGQRSLGATAVASGPATTALLVEAADVWLTPRPAAERVPASARLVTVSISPTELPDGHRSPARRIVVTDRAKVSRLIAAVNALPASQPGVTACPLDDGSTLTLAFRLRRHGPEIAFVDAAASGCGSVDLTLHGHSQPALGGGFTLPAAVDRILGIR